MTDFELIYGNHFGVSFYLKRCTIVQCNKVQLVFNKNVFHFSKEQLYHLKIRVECFLTRHKFIENTKVSKAIKIENEKEVRLTYPELKALMDLVCGTLFQLNFESTVYNLIRD